MPIKRQRLDPQRKAQTLANLQRDKQTREQSYREQAMKLFPHVCERCGREFSGKQLRELTVHHRDNNHFNNPPDGSNWALLCLYCHDDAHGTMEQRGLHDDTVLGIRSQPSLGFEAFAELKNLLPTAEENDREPPSAPEQGP